MPMTIQELAKFCKAQRIQEARADGLHIILHPSAFEDLPTAASKAINEPSTPEPTDEEFMFWSVDAAWAEPKASK